MSSIQIISEINKIIARMPEEKLPEVLKYLQATEDLDTHRLSMAQHFNQIMKEDRNLLKRLAK